MRHVSSITIAKPGKFIFNFFFVKWTQNLPITNNPISIRFRLSSLLTTSVLSITCLSWYVLGTLTTLSRKFVNFSKYLSLDFILTIKSSTYFYSVVFKRSRKTILNSCSILRFSANVLSIHEKENIDHDH